MNKIAIIAGGLLALNATALQAGDYWNRYEVTVTNATYGQVLTPPLVIVHKKRFQAFAIGDEASPGLTTMAETGSPAELAEEVSGANGVRAVAMGEGVIPPGESLTVSLDVPRGGLVSVMGMLASTNDAIYAAQGIRGSSARAHVYDAGTEANTELCADIPGPPCLPGSNNRVTEGAEGHIHSHRGFHGVNEGSGDEMSDDGMALKDENLDWRGPAAIISIKRRW